MDISFDQLPQAVSKLQEKLNNIERLLLENSNLQPSVDELLTIQQAAEVLSLSVPTIYGLVSRSEVPYMKKGKRLYFSGEELTSWIKSGRKRTVAEINASVKNYLPKKS